MRYLNLISAQNFIIYVHQSQYGGRIYDLRSEVLQIYFKIKHNYKKNVRNETSETNFCAALFRFKTKKWPLKKKRNNTAQLLLRYFRVTVTVVNS